MAEECDCIMGYVDRTFRSSGGAGFVSAVAPTDRAYQPHPQRDENVAVAACGELCSFTTPATQGIAASSDAAMRYLGGRADCHAVAGRERAPGGL